MTAWVVYQKLNIKQHFSYPERELLAAKLHKAHSWKIIRKLVEDLGQPNNFSANRNKYRDTQFIEHLLHFLLFDMRTNFSKTVALFNRNSESLNSLSKPHLKWSFKHTPEEMTILTFLRLGNTKLEIRLCKSILSPLARYFNSYLQRGLSDWRHMI